MWRRMQTFERVRVRGQKIKRNEFVDEEMRYKRIIIDVGGRNKWIKRIEKELKKKEKIMEYKY